MYTLFMLSVICMALPFMILLTIALVIWSFILAVYLIGLALSGIGAVLSFIYTAPD